MAKVTLSDDARRVWERMAARIERGEVTSWWARQAAAEILGRPIPVGGRHAARPDTMDRAAGDRTVGDDDEWVTL